VIRETIFRQLKKKNLKKCTLLTPKLILGPFKGKKSDHWADKANYSSFCEHSGQVDSEPYSSEVPIIVFLSLVS